MGFEVPDKLLESFPTTATLERRASDYGLSSLQHRCYQALWQSLRSQVLHGLATTSDAIIDGIAIALTQSDDYSAAIRQSQRIHASSQAAISSSTLLSKVNATKVDAESADSVLVTGVVAGALSGRRSLPVLWQLQHNMNQSDSEQSDIQSGGEKQNSRDQRMRRSQVVDMADCLFDQWAGITRKPRTIIAK